MKSNKTILVITALVVAAGLYWYFFTGTSDQPPLSTGIVQENKAQTQFTLLVSELQPITFDTGIFTNANFTALIDLSTPIAPETSGRLDPFATIPGVVGK